MEKLINKFLVFVDNVNANPLRRVMPIGELVALFGAAHDLSVQRTSDLYDALAKRGM